MARLPGKTTLARALSRRLSLPLFSKDVIKEDTLHVNTAGHVDLEAVARWCGHPH